jgi:hypothetical protein
MIDYRKATHRTFGFWFCVSLAFFNFGLAMFLRSIPEVADLATPHIWFMFLFAFGASVWWYIDRKLPPEQ